MLFTTESAESAEGLGREENDEGKRSGKSEEEGLRQLSGAIIGAAIEVHRALGPGLLESAYEACLAYELTERGYAIEQQRLLPVLYKGVELDCLYRLDLVVEEQVLLELKVVERILPVHQAQILSYLRLSRLPLGLLINFHCATLKEGVRRFRNSHTNPSPSALSALSVVKNS
jgi:GxxExxY protein